MGLVHRTKEISCGSYCVGGVKCIVIQMRHSAGESIKHLMWDYGMKREEIQAALSFRRRTGETK